MSPNAQKIAAACAALLQLQSKSSEQWDIADDVLNDALYMLRDSYLGDPVKFGLELMRLGVEKEVAKNFVDREIN